MIDDSLAKELQEQYIKTRDPETLFYLKSEVEAIAWNLARTHMAKSGCFYSADDMATLADSCAIRFIEQYLKHETWICKHFSSRVMLEVKYYLYNPKAKRGEPEEITDKIQEIKKEIAEDTGAILGDIIGGHPYWRNVLLDCYKAKAYKDFILTIDQYSPRRWIYDHAARLRLLYKYTRRQ